MLVRQRPGIGNAIFMTLEDETAHRQHHRLAAGVRTFRPIVLGSRLIGVTGVLQNEKGVIHIVADRFENLTPLLRRLSEDGPSHRSGRADRRGQAPGAGLMAPSAADAVAGRHGARRQPDRFRHPRSGDSFVRMAKDKPALEQQAAAEHAARVMPKGRNFH